MRIALDDFGKGATSLAHFRGLPLDVVKLDRAFVNGLREGETSRAIVDGARLAGGRASG